MKKLAILAAVLMLVPASVMAGMNILNESSLNDVTGQVGISIDQTVQVNDGFIAWTDSDGGTDMTTQGVLVLDNLTVNGAGGSGAMTLNTTTIDCGTDGTTTKLRIGQPSIVGQIAIGQVLLGTSITAAQADGDTNCLGAVTIGDLNMSGSTMTIYAHD